MTFLRPDTESQQSRIFQESPPYLQMQDASTSTDSSVNVCIESLGRSFSSRVLMWFTSNQMVYAIYYIGNSQQRLLLTLYLVLTNASVAYHTVYYQSLIIWTCLRTWWSIIIWHRVPWIVGTSLVLPEHFEYASICVENQLHIIWGCPWEGIDVWAQVFPCPPIVMQPDPPLSGDTLQLFGITQR